MAAGPKGSWSDGGASDGELLVGTADRLRWRAPELALEFARQAARRADAARDRALSLRANALAVAALVRLGKHAEAVEPAVRTLREAEAVGAWELVGPLRVDLAASTRAVGLAGSALVLVRPMLEGGDVRPAVRAGALAEIVGGLAQAGRRAVVDEVLSEADRLYAADETLTGDVRRMLRALLCARIASFRRRWGNVTGAVAAATEGMTLLDGLSDLGAESGQARAELGLEMVSALLDAGESAAALGQAEQSLRQPIRATSAAATGRLMLVLATRVHIPAGRAAEAHGMFAEIVHVARRHGLHALLADVLTSLAHEQETAGELTDALNSLRSARAAEHRRLRADTLARLIVLEELGAGTKLPDDTEALLRRVVRSPVRSFPESPELSAPGMAVGELKWPQQPGDTPGERDAETGLLNRQGLRRRLAAARRQVRPTALTLVRLDSTPEGEPEPQQKSNDPDSTDRYSASLIQSLDRASGQAARDIAPDVLSSLAGHVRDIAPEHTELVRPEDGELAVLMPDTTREQAEQFAATLRETMSTSDWDPEDPARGVSVSTGVAQYEGTSEDAFLTAAREDLTSTDPEFDSYTDTSGYTRGRHIPSEHIADHVNTGHVNTGHVNTGHVNTGHVNTGHVNTEYADSHMERPAWQSVEPVYDMPSDDISFGEIEQRADGYTYMEQYAAMEQYAPPPEEEPEPADAEMDAYLAGFSLPEYGQQWPPSEETEPQAPKHDAASINDAGRSVLDRLGITRGGGGGRRRAPDSSEPQQCDPGQFDPDQSDQGLAGDASSSGIGEEVLAASAASASIPQPPGPDAVPGPPDSPDIPIPPDPDVDPAPPRRRAPDPSDPLSSPEVPIPPNPDIEPTTSARRLPTPPAEPRGLAAPDTDDHSSAGRRRSPTGEQEQELASSESAPESEVPVSSDVDPSAWRRKFAAQPREAPGSDATVERAARRRRPPVLPPDPPDLSDPSELMDPPVDAPESNESPRTAGRPSRLRKREKTDVGLADLLAEALVAYQSSHSDSADEDVLPVYEGLSATPDPLGPDSGRHRFPDRASAERDTH